MKRTRRHPKRPPSSPRLRVGNIVKLVCDGDEVGEVVGRSEIGTAVFVLWSGRKHWTVHNPRFLERI